MEESLARSPTAVAAAIADHLSTLEVLKSVIVLEGVGVLLLSPGVKQWRAAEELLTAHVEICARSRTLGGVQRLPEEEIAFIAGMEGEEHRQRVQANYPGKSW